MLIKLESGGVTSQGPAVIYRSSPRCHGTDDSHINVAATGNNNKRGTLSRLPEPTYSLVTFRRRRNETFSSLPLLRGPFPRQVSALTDSGGETQYAHCRPLPRLCGKKMVKKKLKSLSKLPHFQRNSSTLIGCASRRKCPQISFWVCCCFVFVILFVRHGSAPFPPPPPVYTAVVALNIVNCPSFLRGG